MKNNEVIIKVGAAGGSLTLYGLRSNEGWQFSRSLIDQSLVLMDGPEIRHASNTVNTWLDALKLLDKYSWHRLCPISVHTEFRGMVMDAVLERFNSQHGTKPERLSEWGEICGIGDGESNLHIKRLRTGGLELLTSMTNPIATMHRMRPMTSRNC